MSKEAMNWATEQRLGDPILKALLRTLAFEANKGTGECSASQPVLAEMMGMSDRSIRTALKILEVTEIIQRRRQSKGRYGRGTDTIILSLDRRFDISRQTFRAIRSSLRNSSKRNIFPDLAEQFSGELYTANTEDPYQVEKNSYGREDTYTHEACEALPDAGELDELLPELLPENVVPFPKRGGEA